MVIQQMLYKKFSQVEMRNRSKRAWILVGTTKETSFRVADNISPENEYEFRVTASNQVELLLSNENRIY